MSTTSPTQRVSVILLAGGIGTRMQLAAPKQFLNLAGKPIVRHSFDTFLTMPEIEEIVVVCLPEYHNHFIDLDTKKKILFAEPGILRQDSVYNGLMKTSPLCNFLCIHDGARPFINLSLVRRVLNAGISFGAATAAMPITFTVKETDENHFVRATPDRSRLFEIQTPQVIRRDLLNAGFQYAKENHLTVTDDVSLVELLGKEVKLVEGSPSNLKITLPADLTIAANYFNAPNIQNQNVL